MQPQSTALGVMEASAVVELISMEIDQINATTEFWLACVFAVIAASHLARDSLNVYLRVIIVVLFALVTTISIYGLLGDRQQIVWLLGFLHEQNIDPPLTFSKISILLKFLLFGIGSIATVGYVFYVGRESQNGTA
ncbi:MAG: hypothetical protein HKO07_01630 [Pseudomonadales bacterium]|nr:hypothetical protein [Pseudomonadales bacterium]